MASMQRPHLLRLLLVAASLIAPAAAAPPPPSPAPAPAPTPAVVTVAVEPARTSIYVGTVSLTMPTFVRRGSWFEATYDCKVFPYFFANEHGTLRIEVPDADLHALQHGQAIDFRGEARSHRDAGRTVEGRATPETPTEGRIKVRVKVTRRIELIFNTNYRLATHPPGA